MKKHFLGGLTAQQFLKEYWQKKPLLIRNAFPGFTGVLTPDEIAGLACSDDMQSRLVTEKSGKWKLLNGPFAEEDFAKLPKTKWSLLVQGINNAVPEASQLLHEFNFIPHARLDDIMVSYAPKNGGIGPHFDSYDVFLLQGDGHKRWQVSTQLDMALIPDAPLRILQNFQPEAEWIVGPGDLLYLPPRYAHYGVALDDCTTYSIGFRAPSTQELATQFLVFLEDRIHLEGIYQDPNLAVQKHPAEIGGKMIQQVENMLKQIRWDREDIIDFLGQYLSEPKSHIFFDAPTPPLTQSRFTKHYDSHGIRLALQSQMLFQGHTLFLNGEAFIVSQASIECLANLADNRTLAPGEARDQETLALLYQWYASGYIDFIEP